MSSKHVTIVGGGVIGLATAYYCAKAGHQVTLIDREPEQRTGCSFGNAGMIVPSHFIPLAAPGMLALGFKWMWNPESPFYIKPRVDFDLLAWGLRFCRAATAARVAVAAPILRDISLMSRALYDSLGDTWMAAGKDIGFTRNGLLMLCKDAHTLEEEAAVAARARDLGIPAEVLDPTSLAKRDPNVTMSAAGAVYYPKDAHLAPERLLAVLLSECQQLGVRIHWQTEWQEWKTAGGRIEAIKTSGPTITADEFVLCGGVWSSLLAKKLGVHLPMQAGKGYSVTLKNPRQLPSLCSIFTEARVAVTPMAGALRVGGTMEVAGINDRVDPRRVHGILRSVPEYFPEFAISDFAGIEPWFGLRPCAPDGMPYLGRTQRWQNLTCSTGHAMMGLSLAPASGKIVADILSGHAPAVPLDLFSPDRF